MTKILIVDNEEEIRLGLKDLIEWEMDNFEVSGLAENGLEALEIIKKSPPDIMLLDVRMPVLNGIDLLKLLKEENINICTIIISGYDEFNYAREAMKYGAKDYILKPCDHEEIIELLQNYRDDLTEFRRKTDLFNTYYREIKNHAYIIKEKYLKNLLHGDLESIEIFRTENGIFSTELKDRGIFVMLLRIGEVISRDLQGLPVDREVKQEAVFNKAKKYLTEKGISNYEVFRDDLDVIVIFSNQKNRDGIKPIVEKFAKTLKNELWFNIVIGVGKKAENIEEIPLSYDDSKSILRRRLNLPIDTAVVYAGEEIETHETGVPYPVFVEKNIINCLIGGKKEILNKYLRNFYDSLSVDKKTTNLKLALNYSLQLYNQIYRICLERAIEIEPQLEENEAGIINLINASNIESFIRIINALSEIVYENIHRGESSNHAVNMAIEYIHQHYNKDIYLDLIADKVGISSSYLCSLFKKHMGKNFLDYLHAIRIREAEKLLKSTGKRIYEIAEVVGYFDEKYFTKVFKRYKGMTPREFRNM